MALHEVHTTFYGICTHMDSALRQVWPGEPAVEWRVVLVNATIEDVIHNSRLHGHDIAPHVPKLQIRLRDVETISNITTDGFSPTYYPDEDVISWRLYNVTMWISNALPGPRAATPLCLPHLADLSKDLGSPSEEMTVFPVSPGGAAAYFDFFSGDVRGYSFGAEGNPACVGVVSCRTVGAPQLRVRSFDPAAPDVASITLKPDAKITVSNIPEPPNLDSQDDFHLHFLNAARFPKDPQTPGPCQCPPLFPPGYRPTVADDNLPKDLNIFTTTPGCSNSTYP